MQKTRGTVPFGIKGKRSAFQLILPVDIATGSGITGFLYVMDGVVERNEAGLVAMLKTFNQASLDSCPDSQEPRGETDRNPSGVETVLQDSSLSFLVLTLPVLDRKLFK